MPSEGVIVGRVSAPRSPSMWYKVRKRISPWARRRAPAPDVAKESGFRTSLLASLHSRTLKTASPATSNRCGAFTYEIGPISKGIDLSDQRKLKSTVKEETRGTAQTGIA